MLSGRSRRHRDPVSGWASSTQVRLSESSIMRRTSDRLEVEIKDNANNQCRSHRTQRGMPSLITLVHAFLAGGQASASVIDILGKAADYAIAPISAVAICQMPPQCRARI